MMQKISIVIPILNEKEHVKRLLDHLLKGHWHEIIVVDGGSTDGTLNILKEFNDSIACLTSGPGRSIQMNKGASVASGQVILFLHADSMLPNKANEAITHTLLHGVAGCFKLKFDHDHWLLRIYAWFAKFNLSIFTYGDQGLFMFRSAFDKVGGFPDIVIMEDVEMIKKLKKRGKFIKCSETITTSTRRFRRHGIFKQQVINVVLVLLYKVGVSPKQLRSFYTYNED